MVNAKRMALYLTVVLILSTFVSAHGQDERRFKEEVANLMAVPKPVPDGLIIFAGSSSIRMWQDVTQTFVGHNIVNRGFGGSQMDDLLYYLDDLVLTSKPCQVFIYEGDNDLNAGKSIDEILKDTRMVIDKIKSNDANTQIVLITAKPSVARWHLKSKYEALNLAFSAIAQLDDNVEFADVWSPALDQNGMLLSDIFLDDNLHMNQKGYDIWRKVIGPFLRDCSM